MSNQDHFSLCSLNLVLIITFFCQKSNAGSGSELSDSEYETLEVGCIFSSTIDLKMFYRQEETADEYSAEFTDEEEEVVNEERQSGDGEEEPESSAKLDDDEDKKNPAYIPRTGYFYEHDDRKDEEEEKDEKEDGDNRSKEKGQLWVGKTKWEHDKFRQDEQAPKSRTQIIAKYGYDIRSEDDPPTTEPSTNNNQKSSNTKTPSNRSLGDFFPRGRFRGGNYIFHY